jgi:hypothetical protein
MTTEIAIHGPNPFEQFGDAATGGRPSFPFMKFSKGDYVAGKSADEIPVGSEYIALPKTLTTGYVGWENGAPTDRIMGRVVDGFVPPRKADLPQRDQSTWERDDRGEPRDPYALTNEMVFVNRHDQSEIYTFTTSSRGGVSAIGLLAKAYGARMRSHPTEVPIVKLAVDSYLHSNRAFGRIKVPKFDVVGWTDEKPFMAAINGAAANGHDSAGLEDPPF